MSSRLLAHKDLADIFILISRQSVCLLAAEALAVVEVARPRTERGLGLGDKVVTMQ